MLVEATGERKVKTTEPVMGLWREMVGRGEAACVDERMSSLRGAAEDMLGWLSARVATSP